jgi:hypothetical protein
VRALTRRNVGSCPTTTEARLALRKKKINTKNNVDLADPIILIFFSFLERHYVGFRAGFRVGFRVRSLPQVSEVFVLSDSIDITLAGNERFCFVVSSPAEIYSITPFLPSRAIVAGDDCFHSKAFCAD